MADRRKADKEREVEQKETLATTGELLTVWRTKDGWPKPELPPEYKKMMLKLVALQNKRKAEKGSTVEDTYEDVNRWDGAAPGEGWPKGTFVEDPSWPKIPFYDEIRGRNYWSSKYLSGKFVTGSRTGDISFLLRWWAWWLPRQPRQLKAPYATEEFP